MWKAGAQQCSQNINYRGLVLLNWKEYEWDEKICESFSLYHQIIFQSPAGRVPPGTWKLTENLHGVANFQGLTDAMHLADEVSCILWSYLAQLQVAVGWKQPEAGVLCENIIPGSQNVVAFSPGNLLIAYKTSKHHHWKSVPVKHSEK